MKIHRSATHKNRRARNRLLAGFFESLEPRQLLSLTPGATPVWNIRGDSNQADLNDTISLLYNAASQQYDLTINGTLVQSRDAAGVRAIVIRGGKGNDTITVDTGGRRVRTTVDGGRGNNTLITNQGAHVNLHGRFSSVSHNYNPPGPHYDLTDPTGGAASPLPPNVQISDALRQRLIDEAVERNQNLLGTTYSPPVYAYPYLTIQADGGNLAATTTSSSTDHSTTNNQVQGVNEADLVQTDGSYIYTLTNGELTIVDVRDPANAHVVSTTQFSGWGSGLYLDGSRVIVLTTQYLATPLPYTPGIPTPSLVIGLPIFYPAREQTTAWVFDVSVPTAPSLIQKTSFSGSLDTSRMIGDQLYLVINNDISLPGPQLVPLDNISIPNQTPVSSSIASIPISLLPSPTQRYQTEAEYRQWLADNIDQYIPYYSTTLSDGSQGPNGSLLDNIAYLPDGTPISTLTTLADIDVTADTAGPAAITTAAGSASTVYVSNQNLYMFTTRQLDATPDTTGTAAATALILPYWGYQSTTDILKFNLGVHTINFDAAGHVDGSPLNSYSMDEYNGQLRVVTETYNWQNAVEASQTVDGSILTGWTTPTTHSLYVLSDNGSGTLGITGELDNLGNGELLRSVLFEQDRAFVVTFQQVDPLFAIDLSNPSAPVATGQLVMPGFSTYLFPIDQDHLIGVGQGEGATPGNFHTVQIALYDVSDLANPVLVDQKLYDAGTNADWGSVSSDALYDPHAFSYFADPGILAIPLDSWSWNSSTGTSQNTLEVLKIDPAAGFTELGQVSQESEIQRSVRIGDDLYSVSTGDIKIVQLQNPANVIADVPLPPPPSQPTPGGIVLDPPIQILSSQTLQANTISLNASPA